MDAFEVGNCWEFMKLWDKHLPIALKADLVSQKLEFYLNIHFAILPFRPEMLRQCNGDARKAATMAAKAMQGFRKFLETRGKELAQSGEFLAYYALPYVPNPSDHPSFKVCIVSKSHIL